MYSFFTVSQTYDNLTNILLYYNNFMDQVAKANIPEFIRSNDGTNRIKNLEEIRSIVRELNSTDLFTLYDRLH